MSTISFSGLATGMDTASIVSQLMELKRAPIYRLQSDRTNYQHQISSLNTLKEKLTALQTAAQALDTSNEFAALTATSSNEDLLQVTANSDAAPGNYNISIESLAESQKSRSQGYDNTLVDVGTGTYSFTVGGEAQTLEITEYTSLEGLAERINTEIDGVSASIIWDGSDSGGYFLSLTGEAGSSGAFTVDASGVVGGQPPMFTETTPAADAHLFVDGIEIWADGNQVDNIVSGLSLDLRGAEAGTEIDVAVTTDSETVKEQVKGFIDAYNDAMLFMETSLDSSGKLYGNTTARSVMTRIQNVMNASHGGNGNFSMMAQIGITRQQGTKALEFDETKFADAVAEDYMSVRDLFIENGASVGKAALFDTAIDQITDSVDGMFKIGTETLNTRIDNIDNSIERYERSIDSYQTTLERKFVAMEQMVAQLNAQGSSLMSIGSWNQQQ